MSNPVLNHFAEFKAVLDNYQLSDEAKAIVAETKLVVLVGPSGGGRNTLIREMLKTDEYHFLISDTTRPPRINDGVLEVDGREYWFRREEDFLKDLRAGAFLEAEILHGQQVSGTSIREIEAADKTGKVALADMDMGGGENVLQIKPDAYVLLVIPPSFKEWQRRFLSRGKISDEEYHRRMKTAERMFVAAMADKAVRIIVNDDPVEAAAKIHQLVKLDRYEASEQQHGMRVLEELLRETEAVLKRTA